MTGFNARLKTLLDQPTYATLMERVLAGDTEALETLARIRTKRTVTCLLRVMTEQPEPALRRKVQRALRGIAPAHYSVDPNGFQRWRMDMDAYRYSLADDRLVKR
jgi:hypothetical protein